jgi:hypothetical protein
VSGKIGAVRHLLGSDHVFEDRFAFSRINHLHLEPYVNVARASGEQIELWSCNQDPFVLRNERRATARAARPRSAPGRDAEGALAAVRTPGAGRNQALILG